MKDFIRFITDALSCYGKSFNIIKADQNISSAKVLEKCGFIVQEQIVRNDFYDEKVKINIAAYRKNYFN